MATRPQRRHREEDVQDPLFVGTLYSPQECAFLIEHLGEPSALAFPEEMDDDDIPEGVNPAAVIPILDRTYHLDLIEKAYQEKHGDKAPAAVWVGYDRLKELLQRTIEWNQVRSELKARARGSSSEMRRAAGAPTLAMWDPDTNIPAFGAEGSDAEFCRTAFDEHFNRVPLYTALREASVGSIRTVGQMVAFLSKKKEADDLDAVAKSIPNDLIYRVEGNNGNVICPVCQKSEAFIKSKSSTKTEAKRKMMAHLKSPDSRGHLHRVLYRRLTTGHHHVEPEPVAAE